MAELVYQQNCKSAGKISGGFDGKPQRSLVLMGVTAKIEF
jgi:hypothetical protein